MNPRVLFAALPLLAACLPALGKDTLAGPVAAEVVRTLDGDTLEVRAQIWLNQELTTHVRLRGIDTPELHTSCAAEKQMAETARQRLSALAGNSVSLTLIAYDKYGGRVDANIANAAGVDLKTAMLATGLAHPYDGSGARVDWCPVGSVK